MLLIIIKLMVKMNITIQVSQNEWEIVNDNVMGGVSIGDFKFKIIN